MYHEILYSAYFSSEYLAMWLLGVFFLSGVKRICDLLVQQVKFSASHHLFVH